jgi:two-component system chemotaxis sensor kinase CheA
VFEHSVRQDLEDLNARLLAADPGDPELVAELREALEGALAAIDEAGPAAELLARTIPTLESIEGGECSDASSMLDRVSAALASAISDGGVLDGPCETGSEAEHVAENGLTEKPGHADDETTNGVDREAESENGEPHCTGAVPSMSADRELLDEFIAESSDRLADAEAGLLALESAPGNAEQINRVLRAFHTIKGAAGFLELGDVQRLAHLAENLLSLARSGEIDLAGPHADLALRCCDTLKAMLSDLRDLPAGEQPARPPAFGALTAQLIALDEGKDVDLSSSDRPEVAPKPDGADDGESGLETDAGASSIQHARTETSVRVDTARLDGMMNLVGELVISHSIAEQYVASLDNADVAVTANVAQSGKIVRQLQDLTMSLRMVPLRATFGKMARLVRDLARKSGKSVRLATEGEDTEIDRNMVETLSDPLIHMIRNAVDHGVETADDRRKAGKPASGTLELRAYHAGGNVVVELSDDGRGLDREAILKKATAAGLVAVDCDLTDGEVFALIFEPGLSTADQVTDVSGRGVGMDVVKRNLDALRGRVQVESTPGNGTRFILHLPLTTAIADAMLLRVGEERYLLPMLSIIHSFRPAVGDLTAVAGGEMVDLRGEMLAVFRLSRLFGVAGAIEDPTQALLVVIEGHGRRCALMVDELLGQHQVVIKSLGGWLGHVPGVSGGTVLGDGRVGLILDAAALLRMAQERSAA